MVQAEGGISHYQTRGHKLGSLPVANRLQYDFFDARGIFHLVQPASQLDRPSQRALIFFPLPLGASIIAFPENLSFC